MLPAPGERNFLGRPDFSIRSRNAVNIAALVMHLHAIFPANFQFQHGHDRGIFIGGSKPAPQFDGIGPGAKNSFAWSLESSPDFQRRFWGTLFFGHSGISVG